MAGSFVSIQLGGLKYLVDTATDTIITLMNPTTDTAGTKTLHDRTNTNYSVPTGKTFQPLAVLVSSGTLTGTTGQLLYADNADGTTNAVYLAAVACPETILKGDWVGWLPTPTMPSAPAAKFINVTEAGSSLGFIMAVVGVEKTA